MCDSRSRQCDLVKPPDRNHECLITYASAHPPSASIPSSGTLPTPTSSDALSEVAALSTSCNTYPIGPCATSVNTSALPSAVAECTNSFWRQLYGLNMTSTSNPYIQVCSYIGVTFVLRIQWLSGCTLVDSQNPQNPIPNNVDISDVTLFQDAFSNCEVIYVHVSNVRS